MISYVMIDGNNDVSDSNDVTYASHAAKRMRHEHADLQKLKGVVPQQNGHWGAQIYANHHKIWPRTFKSEREAALAYGSASIKLQIRDQNHRNFSYNHQTVEEPHFQSHYRTEAVLGMIRDGTYPSKLVTFLGNIQTQRREGIQTSIKRMRNRDNNGDEKLSCTQLFQKELTPSDVGKLNRLVIPKRHAIRHFPCVLGTEEENYNNNVMENGGVGNTTELIFYDKSRRSWEFRYCYWRSSQSYVFTRGWNRFVKDKNLRAKDIIVFYTCEQANRSKGGHVFSLIDVIYNEDERRNCLGRVRRGLLKQDLGEVSSLNEVEEEDEDQDREKDEKELSASHSSHNVQKGFRLFGVHIN